MRTIKHYIDKRAEEDPDRVYLIAPEAGLSLTYRQLKKDSETFGKNLVKLGLKKGDKLGVISYDCIEFMEIYLAAAKSGVIVVHSTGGRRGRRSSTYSRTRTRRR